LCVIKLFFLTNHVNLVIVYSLTLISKNYY